MIGRAGNFKDWVGFDVCCNRDRFGNDCQQFIPAVPRNIGNGNVRSRLCKNKK
jgi:hypothetical protein